MEGTTEKNPVTPGEVLPAPELYGDMLLAAGRYDEAVAAYEAALARSPNRFNSLWGAGQAAERAGEQERASGYYWRLAAMCEQVMVTGYSFSSPHRGMSSLSIHRPGRLGDR